MVIVRDMSAPLYANVDAMHYTVQAEQREAKRHAIKVEARQPSILKAAQVNLFIVLIIHDTLTPIENVPVMSGFADASPWGASSDTEPTEPTVESALEKERVINDILQLRDGLRGLVVRVGEVDTENDKLARDNDMLSTYIDNL